MPSASPAPMFIIKEVLPVMKTTGDLMKALSFPEISPEAVVDRISRKFPIQLPVFVPFPEVAKLIPHKIQLFPGVAKHICIQ